jgi:hypothetical protein
LNGGNAHARRRFVDEALEHAAGNACSRVGFAGRHIEQRERCGYGRHALVGLAGAGETLVRDAMRLRSLTAFAGRLTALPRRLPRSHDGDALFFVGALPEIAEREDHVARADGAGSGDRFEACFWFGVEPRRFEHGLTVAAIGGDRGSAQRRTPHFRVGVGHELAPPATGVLHFFEPTRARIFGLRLAHGQRANPERAPVRLLVRDVARIGERWELSCFHAHHRSACGELIGGVGTARQRALEVRGAALDALQSAATGITLGFLDLALHEALGDVLSLVGVDFALGQPLAQPRAKCVNVTAIRGAHDRRATTSHDQDEPQGPPAAHVRVTLAHLYADRDSGAILVVLGRIGETPWSAFASVATKRCASSLRAVWPRCTWAAPRARPGSSASWP